MILPSKELLSEIVGFDVNKVEIADNYPKNDKSKIYFWISGNLHYSYINIHELAHKCKEWANKKHNILIFSSIKGDIDLFYRDTENYDEGFMYHDGEEPEAIFKACQWMLENK